MNHMIITECKKLRSAVAGSVIVDNFDLERFY